MADERIRIGVGNARNGQNNENAAQGEEVVNANVPRGSMMDHAFPHFDDLRESIARPRIDANSYKMDFGVLQMIQNSQFGGHPSENPHTHLKKFVMICDMQKQPGVSDDAARLKFQTENPREQCHAITLRSGKIVHTKKSEKVEKRENEKDVKGDEKQESAKKGKEEVEEKEEKYIPPEPYKPQLPFPQRFQKAKLDKQFGKFLEVLKKLYINVPFIDALSQMPSYAKFLKEILSNKRRLEDYETVALTEECSAILQRKLPPKLKDPGSFSIPCHIGESCSVKALCDLGASVSLMPLSIYEKLNMGDLKPTHISLQLADRSIKYPEGILENVHLKVGKFYIPVDFVILDMEEDSHMPIILGRPFLATTGALIDVKGEKLTLRVGEDHLVFNIGNDKKKQHEDVDSCLRIDIVDELVKENFRKSYPKASLESCLIHEGSINDENPKEAAFAQHLKGNPSCPMAPIFQVEQGEKSKTKQPSLKEKDAPKVVKK
ncbi:hypothetical protein P3X46_017705 [Hevea brasiliensis]|uniref:Aspartic peptidase DDI1-type domain-containing protein n=1 Tax=Hevea brasiliensis TaxID=3981 RepID=A0ABQ9LQK5_HEVBR|nr:hypothetical protein P3X46_017705 [Hevea brasiliensis]